MRLESPDPLFEEYAPICEVMFLARSTDGFLEDIERKRITIILRELDERLQPEHVAQMLQQASAMREAEGVFNRLDTIARDLENDVAGREVSYVLACAVIYSDSDVTIDETGFLSDLADALGIDDARSEELQRLLI